jgi:hypothetical protein
MWRISEVKKWSSSECKGRRKPEKRSLMILSRSWRNISKRGGRSRRATGRLMKRLKNF